MRSVALLFLCLSLAQAHTVDYQVDSAKAVVVTVNFGDDEAASYSEFELFAPGQSQPFQIGRSDALGRVVFAPHQKGRWTLKVKADSSHGLHGIAVDIEVDESQCVTSFSKPLVARYTRILVGAGLLLGIFGAISLWKRPTSKAKEII